MKSKRKIKIVENVSFWCGLVLAFYAMINIYIQSKSLPQGVCPVNKNRPLIYISIVLLLISVVFSFIKEK